MEPLHVTFEALLNDRGVLQQNLIAAAVALFFPPPTIRPFGSDWSIATCYFILCLSAALSAPLPIAQARAGALGRAYVQAFGDPGHGQDRFVPQAAGHGRFHRAAFQTRGQVRLHPARALEFFRDG